MIKLEVDGRKLNATVKGEGEEIMTEVLHCFSLISGVVTQTLHLKNKRAAFISAVKCYLDSDFSDSDSYDESVIDLKMVDELFGKGKSDD